MEDRERRIGRLEGRQEMILQWLDRLEEDLHGLKDRLAEEGVLDYTDEISEMQQNINRIRDRLAYDAVMQKENQEAEDSDLESVDSVTGLVAWVISTPQYLIGFVIIAFVIGALLWFLEIDLTLPWQSADIAVLASPISLTSLRSRIKQHIDGKEEKADGEQNQWFFGIPPGKG